MPSREKREREAARKGRREGSAMYVHIGRDFEDTVHPRFEGFVDGPVRDWHMTQTEFLEYAIRELGPERAAVALESLMPQRGGEEAA